MILELAPRFRGTQIATGLEARRHATGPWSRNRIEIQSVWVPALGADLLTQRSRAGRFGFSYVTPFHLGPRIGLERSPETALETEMCAIQRWQSIFRKNHLFDFKRPSAPRVISFLANAALALVLVGCTSARPLPTSKRVAVAPPPDDIAIRVQVGEPIGEVVPVDLSIANGTAEPYQIDPSQVFAVDDEGEMIPPVPPSEAIQEAGHANNLKAGLAGAGKSAVGGAVTGAVVGAALGAGVGLTTTWSKEGATGGPSEPNAGLRPPGLDSQDTE